MVGEVQGSVSKISNNFFDVFDVTHAKNKEISSEGNVTKVAFRSNISTVLFVMSILFR